jgi:hypothetical protein
MHVFLFLFLFLLDTETGQTWLGINSHACPLEFGPSDSRIYDNSVRGIVVVHKNPAYCTSTVARYKEKGARNHSDQVVASFANPSSVPAGPTPN